MGRSRSCRRKAKRAGSPTPEANTTHDLATHTNSRGASADVMESDEERVDIEGATWDAHRGKRVREQPLEATVKKIKAEPSRGTEAALETVSPSKRATIAPVVKLLSAVSARVHAAWSRIGVPGLDREGRWNTFLQESLAPYIEDFLTVNEAEERNMAAENDQLLRDVFFLCQRLEEPCKHPALAHVMDVMKECTSKKTAVESNLSLENEGARHAGSSPPSSDGSCGSFSADEEALQDLLLMPTFTSFFLSSSEDINVAKDSTDGSTSGIHATAHTTLQQQEEKKQQQPMSEVVQSAVRSIKTAVAALSETATHQEVQALLRREHQRLTHMADDRLRLLCVLYKQRVLLERPAAEQAVLRAAYAVKYLGPDAALGPVGDATLAAPEARDSNFSSHASTSVRSYHSALSSLKNSARPSAAQEREPKGGTIPGVKDATSRIDANEEMLTATAREKEATSFGTTPTSNEEDAAARAAEEELHLFLEASLITDSVEFRGTSFCLQPRPTAAAVAAMTASVNADAHAILTRGTAKPSPSTQTTLAETTERSRGVEEDVKAMDAGRDSLFPVDLSDVTQYGKRQDLSFARIHREAADILCRILDQNATMEAQTEEEMECIRELFAVATRSTVHALSSAAASVGPAAALPARLAEIEQHVKELRDSFAAEVAAREKLNEAAGAVSTNPSFTSAESSCRTTRATTPLSGSTDGTDAVQPSLYLPSAVRRIFAALSYAPILHHVQTTRHNLQSALWAAQLNAVKSVTAALTEASQTYYAKTKDTAHAQPPSFVPWFAEHGEFTVPAPGDTPLARTKALLAEHIAAAEALRAEASQALAGLQARLAVIDAVSPLLASRHTILTEQRELQVGSRERLLSKKVNMAKQLLHEETVRKRIAKELPKIMVQLEEKLKEWDALVSSSRTAAPASGLGETIAAPELRVDGQSVRELLRQHRDTKAASNTTTNASSAIRSVNRHGDAPHAARTPTPSATRSRSRSGTPPPPSSASHARSLPRVVATPKTTTTATSVYTSRAASNTATTTVAAAAAAAGLAHPLSQPSLRSTANTIRGASRSVSPTPLKPSTGFSQPQHTRPHGQPPLATRTRLQGNKPPTTSVVAAHPSASRSGTPTSRPPTAATARTAASARPLTTSKSPTPSRKASNPVTLAAQRRAGSKAAVATASVFSRLSPKPSPQPTREPAMRSGLTSRSASASNTAVNAHGASFPGPGKYKSSLSREQTATQLSQQPTDPDGEAHETRMRTYTQTQNSVTEEVDLSPGMHSRIASMVQHTEGQHSPDGERLVATSLSRDLADAQH